MCSADVGQQVALQLFVFSVCEQLSMVLNVNLPDLLLQREERRREERRDGIEGMYTRSEG